MRRNGGAAIVAPTARRLDRQRLAGALLAAEPAAVQPASGRRYDTPYAVSRVRETARNTICDS